MQLVSVVIAAHGKGKDLPVMLGSLALQREYHPGKCSRTGATVHWFAGPPCELPVEPIVCWDGAASRVIMVPWGNTFEEIDCPKEGGVGHHTRAPGIQKATGQWIVLTNADNYFVQGWRHRIEMELTKPRVGIVYWNVLNNLWRWSNLGGTQLRKGGADLSCCAVASSIAKKVLFPWREYDGDGDYIEACAAEARRQRLRIVHVGETLSVHN